MNSESGTGRRAFLSTALSATGSALAFALSPSDLGAQSTTPDEEKARKPALSLGSLYDNSTLTTSLTGEAADRLALRRLVDAWAHCADRRLAEEQSNLFTPDGAVIVYDGDPTTHKPSATLSGRANIRAALAVLNKFSATTHFNGQSDVVVNGDEAIGETYCIAHQLSTENGQRMLQILSIRYQDKFVRREHRWYFAERKLITDWSDTRSSNP